jgi:hypothetical protein
MRDRWSIETQNKAIATIDRVATRETESSSRAEGVPRQTPQEASARNIVRPGRARLSSKNSLASKEHQSAPGRFLWWPGRSECRGYDGINSSEGQCHQLVPSTRHRQAHYDEAFTIVLKMED